MRTFEPTNLGPAWQLPWLRLCLIMRQMASRADCHDEDLRELIGLRRELEQCGWFN